MGKTLWEYIISKANGISKSALEDIRTLDDLEKSKRKRREELLRSAGLWPFPAKPDLQVRRHGEFTGQGFRAVKVSYQILEDCWGTAAIYYPNPLPEEKLRAVLYLPRHRPSGIYGYQNHGAM